MTPRVAKTGKSFKGALTYYLHDKRQEGEEERLTSDRVAWTETRNLVTDDPELAGRIMAATAMDADRLKEDAGVWNAGRKSNQHVYSYSLGWHPDEAGRITRAEMRRAADETLRVLGAQDHQAIIIAHTDTDHPHVHVIVNRVSPHDGRMLTNGNDRLKLSQWALHYREARNEHQYCPQRAKNWEIRLGNQNRSEAEFIRENPEEVLNIITKEKSVFDKHDITRTLHRYVDDNDTFQAAYHKVINSKSLVELQAQGENGENARYSTKEMMKLEKAMGESASRMAGKNGFGGADRHVKGAIDRHDKRIIAVGGKGLSEEQKTAIRHVTGGEQIACLKGGAGTGKSTTLAASREVWEKQGRRVFGAALAGKAAEGLQESSGIESRTLASLELGWKKGYNQLGRGDVLVIDEAGMVGSRQLAKFVHETEAKGAKLVLVGDHEQLQAIGAGAAFRAISERTGAAELQEVRRQKSDWQRKASQNFARHRTQEGIAAYARNDSVRFGDTEEATQKAIVRDYLADCKSRPDGSRIALAHRRVDVKAVNEAIRAARQERGELAAEVTYQTRDGKRSFAAGDRIVFLENNRDLEVKNGTLGTVAQTKSGQIAVALDGDKRMVNVSIADYAALDHGYATTIHKSQGATVDRSFVLASSTMDRHLSYVAMTRHREQATLYADRSEFKSLDALSVRLGRERAKETTLDYVQRRGIEPHFMERFKKATADVFSGTLGKLTDFRERLVYWRASGGIPRSMVNDVRAGISANDDRVANVLGEQKDKAGKLSADALAMRERHAQEWEALAARYKVRKGDIDAHSNTAIDSAIESIVANFRPLWQQLGRDFTNERRTFNKDESRLFGKIRESVKEATSTRRLDPESTRGAAGDAFNFHSTDDRAAVLNQLQNVEVHKLNSAQKAEIGAAIKSIKSDRGSLLSSIRNSFLSERAALVQSQATDKERMRAAWRRHGEERKRAFDTSRKSAVSRQEAAKQKEAEPKQAQQAQEREESFKAASTGRKPRATGRKRSRSRKRTKGDDS